MDRAGKQYWDKVWETSGIPQDANPLDERSPHYVNRRFREYFYEIFSNMDTSGKKLLEIGCARSLWLPYFAKKHGFKVSGIDYSEIGCRRAREILSNEKIEGEIVCADFFSPPQSMLNTFDIVVSFGVLEHFKETAACVAALSQFLRPGGVLITNIPNLQGLNGLIQKVVNRTIFDIHAALNIDILMRAHQINGFRTVSCNYFLFVNLGIINFENLKGSLLYKATRLRSLINEVFWSLERRIPALKPNRWSSPYINCVAIKR